MRIGIPGVRAIHFASLDRGHTRERLMHSDTIETEQTSNPPPPESTPIPRCQNGSGKKDISRKKEEETEKHDARLDWSTAQLFPLYFHRRDYNAPFQLLSAAGSHRSI